MKMCQMGKGKRVHATFAANGFILRSAVTS